MCIVSHFLLVLNHRYKFYPDFAWLFFFSLPKIASHDFSNYLGQNFTKGDKCFVPFTRPRYQEIWRTFRNKFELYTKFTPHDLRRGLQKLFRRARTLSIMNIPPDVCNEYGLWKRPKNSQTSFYAGQDCELLDFIYNKVFSWDCAQLLKQIPPNLQTDLKICITGVR